MPAHDIVDEGVTRRHLDRHHHSLYHRNDKKVPDMNVVGQDQ